MSAHFGSKSSQIKSKKDKKNQKRAQKILTLNSYTRTPQPNKIVYQIQDDSPNDIRQSAGILKSIPSILKGIQKIKEDNVSPANLPQPKFNKFNFDRINKVITPVTGSKPRPFVLNIQQCQDGVNPNVVQDARSINYKKPGSKIPHKTCQNFLKSRLEKFDEQYRYAQQKKVQKNNENVQNAFENGQDKVEKIEKGHRTPRYFDAEAQALQSENSEQDADQQQDMKKQIKCFRCGQRGHIARLCDKQQTIKCVYCLGSHFNSECNQKICRNCGQSGHIKSECYAKVDRIRCNKCSRMGHVMRNCGRIVMMGYKSHREKQIRQRYSKQDLQKLKCFKCNGFKDSKGHFNCHEYSSKYTKIYDEPYIYV